MTAIGCYRSRVEGRRQAAPGAGRGSGAPPPTNGAPPSRPGPPAGRGAPGYPQQQPQQQYHPPPQQQQVAAAGRGAGSNGAIAAAAQGGAGRPSALTSVIYPVLGRVSGVQHLHQPACNSYIAIPAAS